MDEKQEKSNGKKVHEAESIKKIENNEINKTLSNKQIKEQNKILKKMFIGIGAFILIIVLFRY